MSDTKQLKTLAAVTPARFDAHVQAYYAWRLRVTEAYWLRMVMEDRADCAPAPDLRLAPRHV